MSDLKEISKNMRKQGNRGTQYPLFVIQSHEKKYSEYGSESERMPHYEVEDLCEKCQELSENCKDIPDFCHSCPSSVFCNYDMEWEIQDRGSFFFTEKECEDHILANAHHYNGGRSFVISAWRNPELVSIMQHILKIAVVNFPSHYK